MALVGLIYLMPVGGGGALMSLADQPHPHDSLAQPHAPADAQYYRDQWIRETAQFYALHPPRRDERPGASGVTAAKASFAQPQSAASGVTQAAHVTAGSPVPAPVATVAAQPLPPLPTIAAAGPPEWIKRWRIVASLAAGLLAGLVFASVWPASAIAAASGSSQPDDDASGSREAADAASPLAADTGVGELIAIRLPAAWVGVRPTAGQTWRRAILASSYLIASLCGWSLLS